MKKSRPILLHDFFEIRGGGERLAILLCKELNLDICFGFWHDSSYDRRLLNGVQTFDLNVSTNLVGWRTVRYARAFQYRTQFLSAYDVAVYSGVVAPLAVRNNRNGFNIFYCHTPPRFIYDQRDFFLSQISALQRPALRWLINYLKPRYEAAVAEMDILIANSENVKRRIHHHLGKSALVIHPPCDADRFRWSGQEGFYLSTARLDPLKRVDLIIKAFRRMPDKRLIVTSGGSELDRLRKMAEGADNITLTGWVDEEQLIELVENCIATIYIPRNEDFGMSPVESMAAGKPVIGVAEGGLLETVMDGETGLLMPPNPQPEDIIQAIQAMTPQRALEMREVCEARAQCFRKEIFLEKMHDVIYQ